LEKEKYLVRENDDSCKDDDFISSGLLTITEEVFSEEEKDEPRDKYNKKVASKKSKNIPTETDNFLEQLYSDTVSPLYHGFLEEMKIAMRNALFCNRELFSKIITNQDFPPEDVSLKDLTSFTSTTLTCEGLKPEKGKILTHRRYNGYTTNQKSMKAYS